MTAPTLDRPTLRADHVRVLAMLANGQSVKQISRVFYIQPNTVSMRLHRVIYPALGAVTAAQAVSRAHTFGLLRACACGAVTDASVCNPCAIREETRVKRLEDR
jgi:DNA-binding CsgD family transcriptional regulator